MVVACGGNSEPRAHTPTTTATTSTTAPAAKRKGLASNQAIYFGFRSSEAADVDLCWNLVGTSAEVGEFNKDRAKSVEDARKKLKIPADQTLLDARPTEHVVGTCQNAFKMIVDYYSPTWTPDKAQKHCADDQMGKWVE